MAPCQSGGKGVSVCPGLYGFGEELSSATLKEQLLGGTHVKASDVMSRKVETVMGAASLEEAARLMIEKRISGLPVVDDRGTVVGMITEGDLMRRAETGTDRHGSWLASFLSAGHVAQDYVHSHARKVAELIDGTVISVAPDASLVEVVAVMESRRVRRVLVIDGGHLVGIVARADLVRALMKLMPGSGEAPAVTDAQIRARFLKEVDEQQWTPAAGIDSEVKDGIIELHGIITDERMRTALRVIAENIRGARGVRDHLVCVELISGAVVSEGSDDERAAAHSN
jgi:CBS domain-containing protein